MAKYTWEFQRQWHPGLWSYQSIAGTPADPRGYEESDLAPVPFAQAVADRHDLTGEWRLAVWDTLRLGVPPVATVERTEGGGS